MSDPHPSTPPPLPVGRGRPVPFAPAHGAGGPHAAAGPPASIPVTGIAGIVVAGLALVSRVVSLVQIGRAPGAFPASSGPASVAFQVGEAVVFGAAAVVLLAASIGCLKRAEWARKTLLVWAVVHSALVVVGAGLVVAWATPVSVAAGVIAGVRIVVLVGLRVVINLILPAFVLVRMRRPEVRAAFAPGD